MFQWTLFRWALFRWASAVALIATGCQNNCAAQDHDPRESDLVEYVGSAERLDAWSTRETVQLRGQIREFDYDKLVLLQNDGSSRTLASAQVSKVLPVWRNAVAASTHQLMVERKYRDVYRTVPEALKSDLVQWQQRILIADLVQAADALGNQQAACVVFLSLAKSNAPPLLYNCIPLCWTALEPSPALVQSASKWLGSEDEVEKLIGASWLLLGEQQSAASQALTQLRSSENLVVAQMAVAQSWRMLPPPKTMVELPAWLSFRDKLLPPLQLGPTELIADRLMRVGETDLAIGQWMRIASVHADQYHRAAAALELAAAQLKRLGRDEEAKRLEPWVSELRGELSTALPAQPAE